MRQVGREQEENGLRFMYRRCLACGYTVRHFQAQELPAVFSRLAQSRQPMLPHSDGVDWRDAGGERALLLHDIIASDEAPFSQVREEDGN